MKEVLVVFVKDVSVLMITLFKIKSVLGQTIQKESLSDSHVREAKCALETPNAILLSRSASVLVASRRPATSASEFTVRILYIR